MTTNKKHFAIFRTECQKWIDRFELNSWDVDFVHEGIDNYTYADCTVSLIDHVAIIRLNVDWSGCRLLTTQALKDCAKHEALHLLTDRVHVNGQTRFINKDESTESIEELVRMLAKLIK